MKTEKTLMLPIEVLWNYRQHPGNGIQDNYSVEEIVQHVNIHGMEALELSVLDDRALITDGNHRIVAAHRLGLFQVPVIINTFTGEGKEILFEHTLQNFKRMTNELYLQLKGLLEPEEN